VPCDVIIGTHDDAGVAILHHGKGTIIYLGDDYTLTGTMNYGPGIYVDAPRYNNPGDNCI
jgi:hypothetical protein